MPNKIKSENFLFFLKKVLTNKFKFGIINSFLTEQTQIDKLIYWNVQGFLNLNLNDSC